MKALRSLAALLLCAATLLSAACAAQPTTPEQPDDPNSPGGVTVEKPIDIPVIDRDALTQQTADGIIALMKATEATYVTLGEQSRLEWALQQQKLYQALQPLLQNTVSLADRGVKSGDDITALLQQLLQDAKGIAVYLPAGRYLLSADVTVPQNAVLVFEHGATLQLSGCTLTVQGYLQAPHTAHLFEGGTVTCTRPEQVGYPQWFGAVANGRHNDTAAVQACVDAFAITVLPATDTQYLLSTVQVGAGRTLRGEGGYKACITAVAGTEVLFSVNGSGVDISSLHLTLNDVAKGSSAFLLNNAQTELTDIHLHRINADRGAHFVSDTGNGKDITHVRLFEIDCRDFTDISYYFRNVVAFLILEHCIIDYAQAVAIHHQTIDFSSFYIENCVGLLMENCDPLGGYQLGGFGGHGYVLRNCAAVFLNRGYADTLNGYGYWFDNVSYSTVINSGSGLTGHYGLLMENCHDVTFELFQSYGRRPLMDNQGEGVLLRGCRDILFTNLQIFWYLNDAFILEDSVGITVKGYTAYENAGAALVERGTSDHNLIDGFVRSDCPRDDVLLGTHSGIYSLVSCPKANSSLVDAQLQQTVGNYSPAPAQQGGTCPVPYAAVTAAFDAAAAHYLSFHGYLQTVRLFVPEIAPDLLDTLLTQPYLTFGSVNVKDFGAKGDGKMDDTAALTQALQQGGTVVIPAGSYRITRTLSVDETVHLCLAPDAVLLSDAGATVSFNGLLQSGAHTVFGGKGTVRGTMQNLYGYVQWFGATGDGSTNDTVAFEKAFAVLSDLLVPCTQQGYLLDGLAMPGRVALRGVGAQPPVLRASDAMSKFITFRDKNATVADVTLDMAKTTEGSVALFFDNAQQNIAMFFVRNVTVRSPHKTVADRRTNNQTLIHNVYFDNMLITAPRDVTFDYGDFFGFIFMRDVVIDHQNNVTKVPAVQVNTNYGLIMENCVVRNAGAGSTGDAYVFSNCWDVWVLNCLAENIGGNGFTFKDMHHCFFMDLTALQCDGNGFVFGSQFDQYHGITADRTAGILFKNAFYLTVSDINVTGSTGDGVALQQSGYCNLYGLQSTGSQQNDLFERGDSYYCVITDYTTPKAKCEGHQYLHRNP